jgi:melibiose permease/lactose/raffinose/galactose permease
MEEQTAVLRGTKQKKLTNRNLYSFSIGTIGRDLACSGLFGGQILNYVYFTKTLDSAQLVVLTILMTAAKIFDALNDPLMGNIIDATHTRWGKFKPWIFIGMLGSSCVVIASFANDLNGWGYVAFFGAMYFLYSIVFTMNDIGYWGMIPSLAHNPSDRNKLTAFTAFCANIGGGLCAICVPILTTGSLALSGSAITAYKYLGVIFVVAFIVLQSVTLIGVKEDKSVFVPEQKEKIGVRQIANIFKRNDQLRWITLTFFPYSASSERGDHDVHLLPVRIRRLSRNAFLPVCGNSHGGDKSYFPVSRKALFAR